jgi:hypothetical protein
MKHRLSLPVGYASNAKPGKIFYFQNGKHRDGANKQLCDRE